MITTMLTYLIALFAILVYYFDSMPNWVRAIFLISWFVLYTISYASEDRLRNRVKDLENEVKELKKKYLEDCND